MPDYGGYNGVKEIIYKKSDIRPDKIKIINNGDNTMIKICDLCKDIVGNKYIIRNNKKLCSRHYVNNGFKNGDKN